MKGKFSFKTEKVHVTVKQKGQIEKRIIRYAGSKIFLSSKINEYIKRYKPDYKTYIEPFFGSGAIFYNLDSFSMDKNYIVADLDYHICDIHNSLRENSFEDYLKSIEFIQTTFGDIKKSKQAYYNFRNWFNSQEEKNNIFLVSLANSCINSMLRFGPNGMNQSYGRCNSIASKEVYNSCKKQISAAQLTNQGYKEIFNYVPENSVLFLDPPYVNYEMPYSKQFNLPEFLEDIKELPKNCLVFYTDSLNDLSNELLKFGWKSEKVREMKSIAPSSHSEDTAYEMLYWKLT